MNTKKNVRLIFITITIILACTDSLFIIINYRSNYDEMVLQLRQRSETSFSNYENYIDIMTTSMLQLSSYVANEPRIKNLFLEGRKAFYNKDQANVDRIRNEIYDFVKDSWGALQGQYFVRQSRRRPI